VIVLPTLRQRIEESPAELELLVNLLVARMTGSPNEAPRVLEALERDLPPGYRWPGNVRELEQAVRRVLLTGRYSGNLAAEAPAGDDDDLAQRIRAGSLGAEEMLERYCALLYRRHGTYEEVARRAGLDRRTVKKYVDASARLGVQ
jgi:DNA-binding NtrC family response regulator